MAATLRMYTPTECAITQGPLMRSNSIKTCSARRERDFAIRVGPLVSRMRFGPFLSAGVLRSRFPAELALRRLPPETPLVVPESAESVRSRTTLRVTLDAMEAAVGQRRPKDVIHHSDQGSQYTSVAFGKRCGEAGVRPSMGSVGDAYDNAMAESFFSTLEAELLSRRRFASQAEARMACFSYIEGWYNPARLHSGLGYRSPMTYEAEREAALIEP